MQSFGKEMWELERLNCKLKNGTWRRVYTILYIGAKSVTIRIRCVVTDVQIFISGLREGFPVPIRHVTRWETFKREGKGIGRRRSPHGFASCIENTKITWNSQLPFRFNTVRIYQSRELSDLSLPLSWCKSWIIESMEVNCIYTCFFSLSLSLSLSLSCFPHFYRAKHTGLTHFFLVTTITSL